MLQRALRPNPTVGFHLDPAGGIGPGLHSLHFRQDSKRQGRLCVAFYRYSVNVVVNTKFPLRRLEQVRTLHGHDLVKAIRVRLPMGRYHII